MIHAILVVAVFIVLLMLIVWYSGYLVDNFSIIDLFWAPVIASAGIIYLFLAGFNFRLAVISLLLITWSLRLAIYLYLTRIRLKIVDKRYQILSAHWRSVNLGFLLHYQFQGLLIFIVSIPFCFAIVQAHSNFNINDAIAIVLCCVGILGESLADFQLHQFKVSHPKQVCDQGLWHYSRHPNYFFEWLTWCGFAIFFVDAPGGSVALVSPLLMYILMAEITGPLTEQGSIESKGEAFLNYRRVTSAFFPLPKWSD